MSEGGGGGGGGGGGDGAAAIIADIDGREDSKGSEGGNGCSREPCVSGCGGAALLSCSLLR